MSLQSRQVGVMVKTCVGRTQRPAVTGCLLWWSPGFRARARSNMGVRCEMESLKHQTCRTVPPHLEDVRWLKVSLNIVMRHGSGNCPGVGWVNGLISASSCKSDI